MEQVTDDGLVWRQRDQETGESRGFVLLANSKLDLDSPEARCLWESETYNVPTLGLDDASIAEIISSVRAIFGDRPTLNRVYFDRAAGADGDEAIRLWRLCLEAGDPMAHFGLGSALCEVGEFREAFKHLRYYAGLAPAVAWNWRWYGYAAEKINEIEEARHAYRRAIEVNEEFDQGGTDASERLAALDGRT
jgi:tetratricopeptide (TPR) repeat protein